GTTRSAVVANELQQEQNIDVNGVILLSSVLNFDYGVDAPQTNPGIDAPYVGALPTYAATALFQHKLGSDVPQDTAGLVAEVTRFADTDYAAALLAGAALDPARRKQVAEQVSRYTGLSTDYVMKANLRVNGMMFEHALLGGTGTTTGRFDTRYVGPSADPLAKEAEYDPQSAAISSAYISAFNDYCRRVLGYGGTTAYKPGITVEDWDMKHQQPGQTAEQASAGPVNVLPDLAAALVYDPNLHVLLNQGYYDLATPFHAGELEMRHLPMPASLQDRISIRRYEAGHMVYVNPDARRQLHDNVAAFIRQTENVPGGEQKVVTPAAH
ncbi:MAG: peptidase S10, partial [Gluconacetobacter diazotrophicus]|nr:peptidase S10 [Gluconacetobacter diazotrophicus]